MRKSLRFHLRLIFAFIAKFRLILVASIIAGVISFVFISLTLSNSQKSIQRIGIVGEYTLDALPTKIGKQISSGLTNVDEKGMAAQGLAESWTASDEGKTWTFYLDKNKKWQDGAQVTSKDINYTFSDAQIIKPDKFTIIFKLKTPLSNFPIIVSRPIFKVGLLGTGEWKVKNLTLAGRFIETLIIENGNEEKIYRFYPNEDRAKLAYELGQVSFLDSMSDPTPFDKWPNTKLDPIVRNNQYVAVFFNTTNEKLSDKDLRQALSYAIDKDALSKNRALGPISPNSWAYNPAVKPYNFDKNHAIALLKEAKIPSEDKKNLKIKLTTLASLLPVAEKIAKNWKEIGVETTLQVTQFTPDDYEAFLAVSDIPNDPDQYFMWHHTQLQTNISKYANPRIDKLLEDGRLELNQTKRKAIYLDFQKYLLEDAPAAFLFHPVYFNISKV